MKWRDSRAGTKYFIPGISGPDVLDATHWLGALLTSNRIIGMKDTPVRQVINRAASLIPRTKHAFCCVVSTAGVRGVFFGEPEEAFDQAADLSAKVHIRTVLRPYRRVLSLLPELYDDMWVGAKGMYKVEPIVADGGEVVVYGPHIRELSQSHGRQIRLVGYQVRDYFLAHWAQYKQYPWGVLAHSTHLKGSGAFSGGVERPRITVTLATDIPEAACQEVNLGYLDPRSIDVANWSQVQDNEMLVVPHAPDVPQAAGVPGVATIGSGGIEPLLRRVSRLPVPTKRLGHTARPRQAREPDILADQENAAQRNFYSFKVLNRLCCLGSDWCHD